MLNHVALHGRLVADPQLRYTQSGTAVTNFRLAVDRPYKKEDGSRDTDFIDCVVWRKPAEFLAQNFLKGDGIIVEGRLQIREYKDDNDVNRRIAEVVVNNFYFPMSHKSNSNGNGGNRQENAQAAPAPAYPYEVDPSDVPF